MKIRLGPNASGKSAIALELSKLMPTNKESIQEREAVEHHLIDIANPNEQFRFVYIAKFKQIYSYHYKKHI